MESIKAKDASSEQVDQIRKNLARKKEDRLIELEIAEAINLANRKGRQAPHPTKASVKKKKNSLRLKFIKEVTTATLYAIWRFIKSLSVMDWLFLGIIFIIVYLFASMT